MFVATENLADARRTHAVIEARQCQALSERRVDTALRRAGIVLRSCEALIGWEEGLHCSPGAKNPGCFVRLLGVAHDDYGGVVAANKRLRQPKVDAHVLATRQKQARDLRPKCGEGHDMALELSQSGTFNRSDYRDEASGHLALHSKCGRQDQCVSAP